MPQICVGAPGSSSRLCRQERLHEDVRCLCRVTWQCYWPLWGLGWWVFVM